MVSKQFTMSGIFDISRTSQHAVLISTTLYVFLVSSSQDVEISYMGTENMLGVESIKITKKKKADISFLLFPFSSLFDFHLSKY